MIKPSSRLSRVKRVFDPYLDRRSYVRLDRNEDPVGWDNKHFKEVINSLEPYDLAAYSDSTQLIERISNWIGCSNESVYVTAGSDAAIKNIFETYVDEGDKVLVQQPCWRMYDVYNDIYRGKLLHSPYDKNIKFDYEGFLQLIRSSAPRIVILANPNQPTGTVVSKRELEKGIETAKSVNSVFVVDEAYFLFSDVTAADLIEKYPNLIVVRTFSKAFGLASIRLGFCLAQPERISELKLLRPVTDANGLATIIGNYALDHFSWIKERIDDFLKGRAFLYEKLKSKDLEVYESHTNFLIVRYPSLEMAKDVVAKLREKNYLIKGPFEFSPLENCIRVGIGPESLMRKFWLECEGAFDYSK